MQTDTAQTTANPSSKRTAIFSIVCGGHFVNHFYILSMSLLVLLRAPANGSGLACSGSPHTPQ